MVAIAMNQLLNAEFVIVQQLLAVVSAKEHN